MFDFWIIGIILVLGGLFSLVCGVLGFGEGVEFLWVIGRSWCGFLVLSVGVGGGVVIVWDFGVSGYSRVGGRGWYFVIF